MEFKVSNTELIWPNKYDEQGNKVHSKIVQMPFQRLEALESIKVDSNKEVKKNKNNTSKKRAVAKNIKINWRNQLIWGDNKYILQSLLKDFSGKIDLIYIDPPFLTGTNFKYTVNIGDKINTKVADKSQIVFEETAFSDKWGKGLPSYLTMLYERLVLIRELLSEKGSLFIHLGIQVNHYVRILLEEIFGEENVVDEIIWSYGTPSGGRSAGNKTLKAHEYIIHVVKHYGRHKYNKEYLPYSEKYIRERFIYEDENGRRYRTRKREGNKIEKQYLDESKGVPLSTVWTDIKQTYSMHLSLRAKEETGYPTQKPEDLLKRIINLASDENDLVADFFCGSGTTLTVAEKLHRRWIGCDVSKWAIHTTKKRLLSIEGSKPFDKLTLGNHERKLWYIENFSDSTSDKKETNKSYSAYILELFNANTIDGYDYFQGIKEDYLVHIGTVVSSITKTEINNCIEEATKKNVKNIYILGWEWELGLQNYTIQTKDKNVTIKLVQIPNSIIGQSKDKEMKVDFFELCYLEAEIGKNEKSGVKVKLINFVMPYLNTLDSQVTKLIDNWSDGIDYWAIDWDYKNEIFTPKWFSFNIKTKRALTVTSECHTYEHSGHYVIVIQVIDIFGNETIKKLELDV